MSPAVAELVRAAELPTIAINTTFKLAPWADMLYAADVEWWGHLDHHKQAMAFAGLKVSCQPVYGVNVLRNTGVLGFDPDPGAVRTGGNSGYQAIHIAMHTKASRILLCGFNMRSYDGNDHWHPEHPKGLRTTTPELYNRWCERFEVLAQEAKLRNIDVVNVTPDSALTVFRKSTLEAELAKSTEHASA
jgi:hypothetical protein